MSLEALHAALGNREGTDAQWRLLVLLALDANADGLVAETSIPAYGPRMGRKAGGVAGVKAALIKSGLLVVVNEQKDGKRGTYRLVLPGLGGAPDGAEQLVPAPPERPKGVKASTWKEFWEAAYPYVPQEGEEETDEQRAEVVASARELLVEGAKVNSRKVTPRELALAAICLLTFNRNFEWQDEKGSSYGLGANLTEIVMRIRDRPSWDAATWVRLVESAWRIRWWEKRSGGRRPTPSVIWSPKSFEQVVQDASAEKKAQAQGNQAPAGRRRYTREATE